MPLQSISTYSTGDTIEASWANTLRDNALILDARTGGDPGASFANKFLAASGLLAGTWRALASGDFPAGVIADAALANAKVSKAGDSMSGALNFAAGSGVGFGLGGQIVDQSSPVQRTIITTNNDRLDIFNEAVSAVLASVQTSGLLLLIDDAGVLFSSGGRLRDRAGPPERTILSAAASRFDVTSEDVATLLASIQATGLFLLIDNNGLRLSSGGHLRDIASTQQTALSAAGDRLSVYTENDVTELLRLTASVFTYLGQGVIHSGNIGSQTVAAAATATTAGSATSAGSATTAATATNANALGGVAPAGYSLVPTSGIYNGDNSTTTVNTGLGSRLKLVILQKTSGPTSDRTMWIFIGDEAIQLNPGAVVGEVTGTFTTGSFAISLAAGTNVGGQSYKWVAFG